MGMEGKRAAADRERFLRDGIAFPLDALVPDAAQAILDEFRALQSYFGGTIPPRRNHKIHLLVPSLYDLVRREEVVAPVRALLGDDLWCWGSSFFCKEPGDPAFVSWHQDAAYWGLSSDEVVTAWIALTPSLRDNGCLKVVPGSHRNPILPHVERAAAGNMLSRGQEVAVDVDGADAVAVELQPGQMSLHHVLIVHGSEPNRSSIPRIGFALRYVPTSMRQLNQQVASATLASGCDGFGHFEPEPRPPAPLVLAAFAAHDRALSLQEASLLKPM